MLLRKVIFCFILIQLTVFSYAQELPAGLSRWNPVGLDRNWVYEGPAFNVYTSQIGNSQPVYRLHHQGIGSFLLTASEEEVSHAVTIGFVNQGIAFFAELSGNSPVYRFRTATGSYFYTLNRNVGQNAGFTYEGVAFHAVEGGGQVLWRYRLDGESKYFYSAGKENPYLVGAYYFDMWSEKDTNMVARTREVYGRTELGWWGGVMDFYGQEPGVPRNTQGWPAIGMVNGEQVDLWDHLKPSIGYYNSRNISTMEKHIDQAADAGLKFFNFYWYWNNEKDSTLFGEGIENFKIAANRSRMNFTVSLYAHDWDPLMKITAFDEEGNECNGAGSGDVDEVVRQLVDLFASPEYLRINNQPYFTIGDGKNIFMDPCSSGGEHEDINGFIAKLNNETQSRLGTTPYILISAGANKDALNLHPEVSGFTCLTTGIPGGEDDPWPREYSSMVSHAQSTHTTFSSFGKIYSPCASSHFDERPRQTLVFPEGLRDKVRYMEGKTPELLRQSFQHAKDAADSMNDHPANKVITVYAWNEWHEGGILEPNVKTGAEDLNILTDVFNLPRRPSECLDQGHCSGQ